MIFTLIDNLPDWSELRKEFTLLSDYNTRSQYLIHFWLLEVCVKKYSAMIGRGYNDNSHNLGGIVWDCLKSKPHLYALALRLKDSTELSKIQGLNFTKLRYSVRVSDLPQLSSIRLVIDALLREVGV